MGDTLWVVLIGRSSRTSLNIVGLNLGLQELLDNFVRLVQHCWTTG
jgi:hypothetical protein